MKTKLLLLSAAAAPIALAIWPFAQVTIKSCVALPANQGGGYYCAAKLRSVGPDTILQVTDETGKTYAFALKAGQGEIGFAVNAKAKSGVLKPNK